MAVSGDGEVRLRKADSTPRDPAAAVFTVLEQSEVDLPSELDQVVLGTTIATNAIVQRSGARTILLTTAGFEDLLRIQRIDRRGLYDLQWVKSKPYASRRDTFGVSERVLADGSVHVPLESGGLDRAAEFVAGKLAEDPELAVAVSLLFSYVNDAHERLLTEHLRRGSPGL